MTDWLRRRDPEDVPSAIAIAVADFCRRAKCPAPPARVREALSLVSADDDFRVRALADAAPAASPLGPFAVVDLLMGTGPAVAAQREETGYYELVASMVAQQPAEPKAPRSPTKPPKPSAPPKALRLEPAKPSAPTSSHAATKALRKAAEVKKRIAPVRRPKAAGVPSAELSADDAELGPPPSPPPPITARRRRELPAPRGRFTQVTAPKQPWRFALDGGLTNDFRELVIQHGQRIAVHKVLAEQYEGRRRGTPLSIAEAMELLAHHGLEDFLLQRERQTLMVVLTEQKGFLAQTAHVFGCTVDELQALITVDGLRDGVEALREKFRREALATPNVRLHLRLANRAKYLDDLGIRQRFEHLVGANLKKLLDETPGENWNERLENLSVAKGLPLDGLKRAMVALKIKARSASTAVPS